MVIPLLLSFFERLQYILNRLLSVASDMLNDKNYASQNAKKSMNIHQFPMFVTAIHSTYQRVVEEAVSKCKQHCIEIVECSQFIHKLSLPAKPQPG